jgi:hypothetical protein
LRHTRKLTRRGHLATIPISLPSYLRFNLHRVMRLVDSPWVTNPSPRSFVKPNAYRVVKWLRRPTHLPSNYPYREHPDKPTMIPYHEWRGKGYPPMDVGYPGDVYVNMTPGKYSLYGRTKTGWAPWTGLNFEKWQLVQHPLLDDRYLFCSETDIKWYSLDAIRTMRRGRDTSISISKAIEIVRSQDHPEDGLKPCSRPGKRKRVENDVTEDDEEDMEEEICDQSAKIQVRHGHKRILHDSNGTRSALRKRLKILSFRMSDIAVRTNIADCHSTIVRTMSSPLQEHYLMDSCLCSLCACANSRRTSVSGASGTCCD